MFDNRIMKGVITMWQEIRTPDGKLLFRINYDEKLVESAKSSWITTVNLETKEVTNQKREKANRA